MSKHTPGPWSLSASGLRTNDGAIAVLHYSAESQDCTHIAYITCQAKFKRGQGWNAECSVRDANARLIAAAPELLAVLQRAVEDASRFKKVVYEAGTFAAMNAAIDKATGGAA